MQKGFTIIFLLYTFPLFAEIQLIPSYQENNASDAKAKILKDNKELSLGLYMEVCSGHLQAVQFFLEKGANAEFKNEDEDGKLPIHCASQKGYQTIVEYLLKNMQAVDAKDRKGRTALHYASYHGHINIIEVLLKKGADINSKDAQRRTPFHYANQGCNAKSIELLHNSKADKNILDKEGKIATDYFCDKTHPFFK